MNYLIVINNEGIRLTSLLLGYHGDTMDELKEKAKQDYPDCILVEDDGTIQNQLVAGDKIYKDGQVVDKPPYVPTDEEKLARIQKIYERETEKCIKAIGIAQLRKDENAIQENESYFSELQQFYEETIKTGEYDKFIEEAEEDV